MGGFRPSTCLCVLLLCHRVLMPPCCHAFQADTLLRLSHGAPYARYGLIRNMATHHTSLPPAADATTHISVHDSRHMASRNTQRSTRDSDISLPRSHHCGHHPRHNTHVIITPRENTKSANCLVCLVTHKCGSLYVCFGHIVVLDRSGPFIPASIVAARVVAFSCVRVFQFGWLVGVHHNTRFALGVPPAAMLPPLQLAGTAPRAPEGNCEEAALIVTSGRLQAAARPSKSPKQRSLPLIHPHCRWSAVLCWVATCPHGIVSRKIFGGFSGQHCLTAPQVQGGGVRACPRRAWPAQSVRPVRAPLSYLQALGMKVRRASRWKAGGA